MPYCKTLKFIHVAIPKTGTTSLVHALKTCAREHGTKLTLLNEKITPAFRSEYNLNEIGDKNPGKAKHLSALQIKYILGEEEFQNCFKFSVVRNSWARVVSRYFFNHQDLEPSPEEKIRKSTTRKFHNLDFETWMAKQWKRYNKNKNMSSQLSKLVDLEGQLLVDYIGRLETFQESLDHICSQIDVSRMEMPRRNGTGHGHYSQFYNQQTRDMVAEMCCVDIEYFNFEFEERSTSR